MAEHLPVLLVDDRLSWLAAGIADTMKSRSLIAAAADLESLRTRWAGFRPDLVFCFCAPDIDLGRHAAARVSAAFPRAIVIGCSTAGEIGVDGACDGLVSLLGLSFGGTVVRASPCAARQSCPFRRGRSSAG